MKIAFVGDIMLGRQVNAELRDAGPFFPWDDALPILQQADLRVGNLEFVLADGGTAWPNKAYNFRSDIKNIESLKAAGIDLVSLANNHVLDFGASALEQMLGSLNAHKIMHAGAGLNMDAARQVAVWTHNKVKVGMIAITDNEPEWEADTHAPGVYYVPIDLEEPHAKELTELIDRAKKQVHLLIVSAHWGSNWGFDVPLAHRRFAHALIDSGADVVYGHSAHTTRGVEVYHGRPIIYSAGDFIDDYAVDPLERNDESFIFMLDTRGALPYALRLYPTVIIDYRVHMARGNARPIAQRMQKLNKELGTHSTWVEGENCLIIPLHESSDSYSL